MGSPLRAAPFTHRPLALALASVLTLFAGSVVADDEPLAKKEKDAKLETVIVTAERRTSDVQKTAVAVSAVGAQQLQDRGVHTLGDLVGQAAGLTLPSGFSTPTQQYVFIRGIGSSRPAGNPSVGIYVDDVYLPRQFANSYVNLPDIEQVEVLRGPQGTLYGQNTSAGAIKVISRDPSESLTGSVDVRAGNLGTVESQAYVSGALVPGTLKASLALAKRESDGYYRNKTRGSDVNGYDTTQGRLKLLFTPSDDLRFDFAIDEAYDHSDNTVTTPTGSRPRDTLAAWDTETDQKSGGLSLKITKDLNENLALKSITAWRRIDDTQPWDTDGEGVRFFV